MRWSNLQRSHYVSGIVLGFQRRAGDGRNGSYPLAIFSMALRAALVEDLAAVSNGGRRCRLLALADKTNRSTREN